MENTEIIREEAADWLTLKNSEHWNAAEAERFGHWLQSSSEHSRIFAEMERIWADLAVLGKDELARDLKASSQHFSYNALIQQFRERMQLEWFKLTAYLAMPAMLVLALMISLSSNTLPEWQEISTAVAQVEEIKLKDGSTITLSPQSTVKYRLLENSREVSLVDGQAHFDVAKDKQRPFVIQSGATSILVVGTQFDVRKKNNDTQVAVSEGHVRVGNFVNKALTSLLNQHDEYHKDSDELGVSLYAGDKITLSHGQQTGNIEHINIDDVATWKRGRLSFKNARLADVIDDVNRYYNGEISVFGGDLADLRVTATFDIDQISSIIVALEKMLPIKTITTQENNLLIVRESY